MAWHSPAVFPASKIARATRPFHPRGGSAMRKILLCIALMFLAVSLLMQTAKAQISKSGEALPGTFATISGAKIYFQECGAGAQTVVLLHDGVLHSAAW